MVSRTNHDYFVFCFSYLERRLSPSQPERASEFWGSEPKHLLIGVSERKVGMAAVSA